VASERGTVPFWHVDEGWGAVTSPGRPGLGFAHFSFIRGQTGFRALEAGAKVEFEYACEYPHDGCQYRVAWAESVQAPST
jgi:cold shock CspA family protein